MRHYFTTIIAFILFITYSNAIIADTWTLAGSQITVMITTDSPDGDPTVPQTLTFTFSRPMPDFDTSNIELYGARKGTFTKVSPTVYTLEIIPGPQSREGLVEYALVLVLVAVIVILIPPLFVQNSFQGSVFQASPPETIPSITLPGDLPLEIVPIPTGSLPIGGMNDPDEMPVIGVTIPYNIHMGKTEVTKAQWQAVMQTTPWAGKPDVINDPESPAVYISWNDVQEFLSILNQSLKASGIENTIVRLPSETEWEYACRGGTFTQYYWADEPDDESISANAWWKGNAEPTEQQYAHVVAQKPANPLGLYDMSGNVWEYCQDLYFPNYMGAPQDGSPRVVSPEPFHVLRGGSWKTGLPYSANREKDIPTNASNSDVGFRIVVARGTIPTVPRIPSIFEGPLTFYPSISDSGSYEVRWIPSYNSASYLLERSSDQGSSWVPIYSGQMTRYDEFVDNGLYRYRVRAWNPVGFSDWNTGLFDCSVAVGGTALLIESNAPAEIHELETQVFTFTFSDAVQGFDISDITVTGGTAGPLNVASSGVYTLEVTAAGGLVTVSVQNKAATLVGSGRETAGATLSNFYRDSWIVQLPGNIDPPLEMIRIPSGTFTMGSPLEELSRVEDETQHSVTLDQDYYISKMEVSQEQWESIQSFPRAQTYLGDSYPVHNVTYNEVTNWLSSASTTANLPSGALMLPTESQWEYAARAGTTTRFSYGDGLSTDDVCATGADRETHMWYCGNQSLEGTKPIGVLNANPWGLHDMHGNVLEWCSDFYGAYPGNVINPTGPETGTNKIIRGGDFSSEAQWCRSALRFSFNPVSQSNRVGFRVASLRPVPLGIAGTVTDGGISSLNQQLFTFVFGAPVTGFDANDVVVNGALKGTFTALSPSLYTLQVNGNGGDVSITVPPNSVNASAPFAGNVGVSYHYFYQDSIYPSGIQFIRIPGGSFNMGSPANELSRLDDEALHSVTISNDYYMSVTEVTQAQWLSLRPTLPEAQVFPGPQKPVTSVSWNDVTSWVSEFNATVSSPLTFRLPTEAEWEYAARAGTSTRFSFGNGFSTDEICATGGSRETSMWYCGNNSTFATKDIAQKDANPWGLYDMHGNAFELCQDRYGAYSGAAVDPLGPSTGFTRVFRGGSYNSLASYCRSAKRGEIDTTVRLSAVGFRVAAVAVSIPSFPGAIRYPSYDADGIFTVSWNGVPGATSYTLERSIPVLGGVIWIPIYNGSATSFAETVEEGEFGYRARAHNLAGASNYIKLSYPCRVGPVVLRIPQFLSEIELVPIPAGSFTMGRNDNEIEGSSSELPRHETTIGYEYWMGKYEVTQEQWNAIMDSSPWEKDCTPGVFTQCIEWNNPVQNISWTDAQEFIAALNNHLIGTAQDFRVRLPSEAEWEYACRGGTSTRFYWGDDPSYGFANPHAWWRDNAGDPLSERFAHPVGQLVPNAFGLYDMSGNVAEYCEDRYQSDYTGAPIDGRPWLEGTSGLRVLRGGSWKDTARIRSAARQAVLENIEISDTIGFRIVGYPARP